MSLKSYGLSMNLHNIYIYLTRRTNVEERIDYKLLEEYGTTSREEVARMIIEDLDTSSDGEAKKPSYFQFTSI